MRKIKLTVAAILCLAGATMAQAGDNIRVETVKFPAGASGTTIKDSIKGRESVSYRLSAQAGQVMTVTLKPSNDAAYFNVYAPGKGPGDEALAVSEMTGSSVPAINQFKGALPSTGEYTISVYLNRAAARRNEASSYALEIGIGGANGATQLPKVENDFADSLAGGPDFWEVTGVSANDRLNIRRGASTKDAVVARVKNGTILRNKGCRMFDGKRWCLVELAKDPGVSGFVAGRFLRESSFVDGAN